MFDTLLHTEGLDRRLLGNDCLMETWSLLKFYSLPQHLSVTYVAQQFNTIKLIRNGLCRKQPPPTVKRELSSWTRPLLMTWSHVMIMYLKAWSTWTEWLRSLSPIPLPNYKKTTILKQCRKSTSSFTTPPSTRWLARLKFNRGNQVQWGNFLTEHWREMRIERNCVGRQWGKGQAIHLPQWHWIILF